VPEPDTYERAIDILTVAFDLITSEGISKQVAVSALVDFVATIGLLEGGVEGAESIRERIRERMLEWKAARPLDGKDEH
jgi:hypothetical protein